MNAVILPSVPSVRAKTVYRSAMPPFVTPLEREAAERYLQGRGIKATPA